MSPADATFIVPDDWWKRACEFTTMPLACVGLDNRFVWVNRAWEDLLGYSMAELRQKTWMDVTVDPDVGGDLASVRAVLTGKSTAYTLNKRYIHKFGNHVPTRLSVARFPTNIGVSIACFIVEASPHIVHTNELNEVVDKLEARIAEMEKNRTNIHIGDNTDGDKTGGNKNSETTIRFLIGGLAVIVIAVAWLFYYVATTINHQPVEPPSIEQPE